MGCNNRILLSGNLDAVAAVVNRVSDNAMVVFLCSLAPTPILLWLQPYRNVTRAGFYDARLRLHRAQHADTAAL